MSKLNIIHVLALILAFQATNVQGLDFDRLKRAYNSAFSAMKTIAGNSDPVRTAKEVYDTCAQSATTYAALIDCAQPAFDAFLPYMNTEAKINEYYKGILGLNADFVDEVNRCNDGVPQEQQGMPIIGFTDWVNIALQKQYSVQNLPEPPVDPY